MKTHQELISFLDENVISQKSEISLLMYGNLSKPVLMLYLLEMPLLLSIIIKVNLDFMNTTNSTYSSRISSYQHVKMIH